jgi:hypothetical protein
MNSIARSPGRCAARCHTTGAARRRRRTCRARDDIRRRDRVFEPATGVTGGPRPGSRRYAFAAARTLSSWPIVATALDVIDLFAAGERGSATRLLHLSGLAGTAEEGAPRAELEQRLARRRAVTPDLRQLQAALDAAVNSPILASARRARAQHRLAARGSAASGHRSSRLKIRWSVSQRSTASRPDASAGSAAGRIRHPRRRHGSCSCSVPRNCCLLADETFRAGDAPLPT